MKWSLIVLWTLPVFFFTGCSKTAPSSSGINPGFGNDLHPAEDIEIRRSSDGLERTIRISNDEWLGDRHSDPKLSCEASSLERLFRFIAEKAKLQIDQMEGVSSLPEGTYSLSFGNKTWKNEEAILRDVLKAAEEAFHLQILLIEKGGIHQLSIKPR